MLSVADNQVTLNPYAASNTLSTTCKDCQETLKEKEKLENKDR